jgi:electron transport complex protein RnfG
MRKMIVTLTTVMVLSGLVLAGTFTGLSPMIEANRVAALNESLAAIFAGPDLPAEDLSFEQVESDAPTIYRGTNAAGALLGYAVRVETQGYGGAITLLVGLSPDLSTIMGIEVVEQVETPGLGGNITTDSFKEQFAGLDAGEAVSYVKNVEPDPDRNEIQAISGATITSRAVVSGINTTLGEAIETIEEEVR